MISLLHNAWTLIDDFPFTEYVNVDGWFFFTVCGNVNREFSFWEYANSIGLNVNDAVDNLYDIATNPRSFFSPTPSH